MAVRKYVSKQQLSDEELKLLFRDVDTDGGGSIGPGEFEAFFFQGTLNKAQFFSSMWYALVLIITFDYIQPDTQYKC